MPSRVRIHFHDDSGDYMSSRALARLAALYPAGYKRLLLAPQWKKLPLWRRCRELYLTGKIGRLSILRERRGLACQESGYRQALRHLGLMEKRRPARQPAPNQANAGRVEVYPGLGVRGIHWLWRGEYDRLNDQIKALVRIQLGGGRRHFRDGAGNLHDPLHYVQRIRDYNPLQARPRRPRYQEAAPAANGPWAPQLGIWRQ